MGIANPRPQMRNKERRAIERRLSDHEDFMRRFMAQGMTREGASREAYNMVKAGIKPK